MNELTRLQSLRVTPVAATAARAQTAFALEQAIGGHRRRLRPTIVVIAFVAAAVLATAAYALYQDVIVGSPAPVSVKNAERMLSEVKVELIPIAIHSPDLEIAKTRAAGAISTSVGPIYLWVAPNRRDLDCSWLQVVAYDSPNGQPNLSGGCTQDGNSVTLYVGSVSTGHGHTVGYVCCYVGTPKAKKVELRFANGSSLTVPVYDKHVLAETDPHDALAEALVIGANGQTVAERHYPHALSPLQENARLAHTGSARIGPWHVIITLRTIDGRLVREETAPPRRPGAVCYQVRLPTGTAGACNQPGPSATALDVSATQVGAPPAGVFLYGPVGRNVRTLELEFEDGTHTSVGIHHGYVLKQVNPRNYVRGHRPTRLIARNASGRIVSTHKLNFQP